MSNTPIFNFKRKRKPKVDALRGSRPFYLGAGLFLLAGLVIVAIGTRVLGSRSDFCSLDDPIYQAVVENSDAWMSSFPETYSTSERKNRPFSIDGDERTYYAEGYWEIPQGKPILLYVITGSDIDSLRGSEGYIYTASGELSAAYWLNNYDIKRLSEQIYCYELP